MLTQKDIELLKETFATKQDLEEKTRLLPTKDDFFTRMDKLSGELKIIRESFELHVGQHAEINDRLEKIENHLHLS